MSVKETFISLGTFRLKGGNQFRFWEDTWLGKQPLQSQYTTLFNIVHRKQAKVVDILSSVPLHVEFRRALVENKLLEMEPLVARNS
jgi:hypothetical protein